MRLDVEEKSLTKELWRRETSVRQLVKSVQPGGSQTVVLKQTFKKWRKKTVLFSRTHIVPGNQKYRRWQDKIFAFSFSPLHSINKYVVQKKSENVGGFYIGQNYVKTDIWGEQ